MTTLERINLFEERYMAWFKATRDYREIKHGEPPDHKAFGLDDWLAKQIKSRVEKEVSRVE